MACQHEQMLLPTAPKHPAIVEPMQFQQAANMPPRECQQPATALAAIVPLARTCNGPAHKPSSCDDGAAVWLVGAPRSAEFDERGSNATSVTDSRRPNTIPNSTEPMG
mmetsp:Transcript_25440/g.49834  ORF Transcript_25440/g.49834 Transcript_25440/m.49834 type:complete len:108 (+) Transcript_25440:465-788(+)